MWINTRRDADTLPKTAEVVIIGRDAIGMSTAYHLSIHGIRMLECFEEEVSQPIDLKQCGYLIMVSSEEEMDTFRASVLPPN
jgi:hypothetical protein